MDSIFAWFQGLGSPQNLEVFDVTGAKDEHQIKIVPALSDNYMYLVINPKTKEAVAVDPVESGKILQLCSSLEVKLVAVLTTHYHSDHSGGNAQLAAELPGLEVVAGERDADRTPAVTRRVQDGESCCFAGLRFQCLTTPCHTRGHISFVLEGESPGLFCGDTLFVAGCGRFMEGTAALMKSSLLKLSQLPQTTRIFCGHEYTVGNLEYAMSLQPKNSLLQRRLAEAKEKRERKVPTVPSTLAEELEQNPFLRASCENISDEEMGKLRRGKDTFTTMGSLITMALDVKGYFNNPEESSAPSAA